MKRPKHLASLDPTWMSLVTHELETPTHKRSSCRFKNWPVTMSMEIYSSTSASHLFFRHYRALITWSCSMTCWTDRWFDGSTQVIDWISFLSSSLLLLILSVLSLSVLTKGASENSTYSVPFMKYRVVPPATSPIAPPAMSTLRW